MTFRVVEGGEEEEGQEDIPEVPSNPRIGAEAGTIMMSTISGMLHSQLALVEGSKLRMNNHGGRLIIVEITIMYHRRNLRTESLRIENLQCTTPETMKIKRELEVPALEVKDIEEIEAWIDIALEETIMMKEETTEESMVLVPVGESLVQIDKLGGNIAMTDKKEETRAPDIDKTQDQDTEERTLQMKAEDTLDTIGEGDAKGPLVMEGPLQANP